MTDVKSGLGHSAASLKYLKRLPDCLKNMFPAKMAYSKAVDIGLVDRI